MLASVGGGVLRRGRPPDRCEVIAVGGCGPRFPTSPPSHAHLRDDDLMTVLSGQQIADAALDGWVNLQGGLQTRILTRTFATGLAVVNAIGAAAEEMDHHPDLDLRYGHLDVRLSSHDARGVTGRDIRLARKITAIAADAGTKLTRAGLSLL